MFLIRADGNAFTGAGHLMRCLSVAQELRKLSGNGEEIHFICADPESAALAEEHGFPAHSLGTDYQDMEAELSRWPKLVEELHRHGRRKEACPREEPAALLVDSYYVTDLYLQGLGGMGYVILMEDFGTHRYPVDCVVNYNAPASLEEYQRLYGDRSVDLLIGSSYVPLRQQFAKARGALAQEGRGGEAVCGAPAREGRGGEAARNVLVTTGGGDSENLAGKILERIYRRDMDFHLVMGRFSPHFEKMKKLEQEKANVHIHYNVENMARLMLGCDIAVTAGGSTVYELAALGVPLLCFSYAENQEALADCVGARGIGLSAGAWHRDPGGTLERIGGQFQKLAADSRIRQACSRRGMALTDGEGAERLARALLAGREKHREQIYG